MTQHARLSASASHRWLRCRGSIKLYDIFKPADTQSVHAAEGTFAHSVAETLIKDRLGLTIYTPPRDNEHYYEGIEKDLEQYVNAVVDRYNAVKDRVIDFALEKRVFFSDVVPHGFGTADAIIATPERVDVFDLKFGKGVKVSAVHNPQLRLYAYGAIREYDISKDAVIYVHIIQPRLNHVSSDMLTVKELSRWAWDYVYPRAVEAYEGNGPLVPGDHCKFCKVKARCNAYTKMVQETANSLSSIDVESEEFAKIYKQAKIIKAWLAEVDKDLLRMYREEQRLPAFIHAQVRQGATYIKDEEGAKKYLLSLFSENQVLKPAKLKSIKELKDLLEEDFAKLEKFLARRADSISFEVSEGDEFKNL